MEFRRLGSIELVFPLTLEDEEEWYNSLRAARKENRSFFFSIRLKEGDLHIGGCGLFHLQWQARYAMVGIVVGDKSKWGQGYGTDAMRVILKYGFMELNLNRIELGVNSYNPRAIKSYEKCGFQHEGRLREAVFRDGKYYDVVRMGILRREWEESRR